MTRSRKPSGLCRSGASSRRRTSSGLSSTGGKSFGCFGSTITLQGSKAMREVWCRKRKKFFNAVSRLICELQASGLPVFALTHSKR